MRRAPQPARLCFLETMFHFKINLKTIPTATLCATLAASSLIAQVPIVSPSIARTDLVNWAIQSSAAVKQTGDVISLAGYDTHSWYAARVPTTVLNALVNDGVFPDPTYDVNFQTLPGALYDSGDNFLIDPPQPDNPYIVSWWYRTQVLVPPLPDRGRLWLN